MSGNGRLFVGPRQNIARRRVCIRIAPNDRHAAVRLENDGKHAVKRGDSLLADGCFRFRTRDTLALHIELQELSLEEEQRWVRFDRAVHELRLNAESPHRKLETDEDLECQ